MKKKSVSFTTSQKTSDLIFKKEERPSIKFQFCKTNLACFMSQSKKNIKLKHIEREKTTESYSSNDEKKKEIKPISLDELKYSRELRSKSTSLFEGSSKAFNNQLLLLQYGQKQIYTDSIRPKGQHGSKELEQNNQKIQEAPEVDQSDVINQCVRVLTQQTDHSSNPVSARITPSNITPNQSQFFEYNYMHLQFYGYNQPQLENIPMQNIRVSQQAPRNRRAVSSEESSAFIVDINKIIEDGRTTIMLKNIPNKYTQDMLLELFQKNHKRKMDFFYLPIDFNNYCNVGYAFINFIHAKFIIDFYKQFHNQKWSLFNSQKICNVSYARIQGTTQLSNHFKDSNVIHQKDKRYRPLIGAINFSGINKNSGEQGKCENNK